MHGKWLLIVAGRKVYLLYKYCMKYCQIFFLLLMYFTFSYLFLFPCSFGHVAFTWVHVFVFWYSIIYLCIYCTCMFVGLYYTWYTFYVSSLIWPLCTRWTLSQTHYQWNISLLIVRIASQSIIFTFHCRCTSAFATDVVPWLPVGWMMPSRIWVTEKPKRNINAWWIMLF